MFDQLSLLVMLLTPVMAYVAGAVIFSLASRVKKDSVVTTSNRHIFHCRNGH